MHIFALGMVGLCSGVLIGWLQATGSSSDKAVAAAIAGSVLAAFGLFVAVFLGKINRAFGVDWSAFVAIISLAAVVWFVFSA